MEKGWEHRGFTPIPGSRACRGVVWGFTLVEVIVVVAIIGLIASIILVSLASARAKAADVRRKAEISQIGRLLSASCYLPDAGPGEYDLMTLVPELAARYPQYAQYVSRIPRDPRSGTETSSRYIYTVNAARRCAVYANLEYADEPVTLPALSAPTPGGGTGVLQAPTSGWNGTRKYFQASN